MQAFGLGLDDLLSYDADIDKKTKSILVPGTMTINCCSRVMLEAENLAWVVFEHVWLLRDLLIKAGLFETGRNCTLGSPSPAGSIVAGEGGDEWVCVSVSVPVQFIRTSSFTPLGKQIVRSIEQRLSVRMGQTIANLGPPAEGTGNVPLGVYFCPPPPFIPASDTRGRSPDPAGVRQYFLPKQRHPMDPARTVYVRTVRPFRPGLPPPVVPLGSGVPITTPCMEES